ncbi:MAG: carbon-nitrogen hydrolase family protein [Verrucomicrobiales bacterium]|nr:carbon-nitrogen hydrolase family protein [Verrucomicrobiales bacterium]
MKALTVWIVLGVFFHTAVAGTDWELKSPRPELSVSGEIRDDGTLTLSSDEQEGLNGYWEKEFPVEGDTWVQFHALRKATAVPHERRSCAVRIEWYGDKGQVVKSPHRVNPAYFGSETASARPDFPRDKSRDSEGRMEVSGVYPVPTDATRAVVQLHLRWAPGGSVEWQDVKWQTVEAPGPRPVTLASVHTQLAGRGRTVMENCELLRPLIEKAAGQGADLIVLPELLTCKGVTHDYASVAESIPGPTTAYFGELAKKHDCYLVVGMPERVDHLVYNVAVLIGPEGEVVGKYRKVTLPREEIARGIAPGDEYPVFETRFGKVGMMICYDVFFPEVARELAMNGAEIIALPIWGGNPRLAAARCAENGVFLVSSTYTDHEKDWMKSAVWNREGDRLVTAETWESVVVQEVDLNQPTYWYGLGDFQSRIAREAPVRVGE